MDNEALQRIDDLEYRLYKYHEWLMESIAERDRLALDAAWGVHYALYAALALIAAYIATDKYFGFDSWLVRVAFAFAVTLIPIAVHVWSNGARMKEVNRLAKLPEWEWKT